ncbi:hypothetical protein M5689_009878 [Euphorbia peplus]|nr:hypothetical protein M5689_009878 [Euphorbia peplus]
MYMDHEIKPQIQTYFLVHSNLYNLKRTLVLLVTVTVFSFFLCLSSGFSVLPNSYYLYFNSCLFSLLTHTLERKYMFLICNGILAFLAKSSYFFSSVSPDNYYYLQPGFDARISLTDSTFYDHDVVEEERQGKKEDLSKEVEDSDHRVKMKKDGDQEKENFIKEDEDEEQENEDLTKEDENSDKGKMEKEEDEDGEEEGSEELVSTEELNRRIEEFIRKMKEEIRIEAQQKLITV